MGEEKELKKKNVTLCRWIKKETFEHRSEARREESLETAHTRVGG